MSTTTRRVQSIKSVGEVGYVKLLDERPARRTRAWGEREMVTKCPCRERWDGELDERGCVPDLKCVFFF